MTCHVTFSGKKAILSGNWWRFLQKRVLNAGQLLSSSHVWNDRPSFHRNEYNRNTPVQPYSYFTFLTQALNCLSHDCKQNTQCQTRVKNTPYFSLMWIKFTPFSDIGSPKAIPFRAAHTSESPCSRVTANEWFVLGSQRYVLIAFK